MHPPRATSDPKALLLLGEELLADARLALCRHVSAKSWSAVHAVNTGKLVGSDTSTLSAKHLEQKHKGPQHSTVTIF